MSSSSERAPVAEPDPFPSATTPVAEPDGPHDRQVVRYSCTIADWWSRNRSKSTLPPSVVQSLDALERLTRDYPIRRSE